MLDDLFSILIDFLILSGVLVGLLYYRRKPNQSHLTKDSKPYKSDDDLLRELVERRSLKTPNKNLIPPKLDDPFLDEIATIKHQSDVEIEAATREYERDLNERFSNDLKIKERLSQFARQYELDRALIALWEEIGHYSLWSESKDIEKRNKLQLTRISGTSNGEVKTVTFDYAGSQYTISEKKSGLGSDYAYFSLLEDRVEVFAIECFIDYEECISYRCESVSAFKKRGNWAKTLLQIYSRIQIESKKLSNNGRYFRADEIKTRFEE